MSQTNIAITQLAQVGYAERIALETQAQPEVARQAALQAAPEELKKLRDAVAETEEFDGARTIRGEKNRQGGQGGGYAGGRRHAGSEQEEEAAQNTFLAGNILNLRV